MPIIHIDIIYDNNMIIIKFQFLVKDLVEDIIINKIAKLPVIENGYSRG